MGPSSTSSEAESVDSCRLRQASNSAASAIAELLPREADSGADWLASWLAASDCGSKAVQRHMVQKKVCKHQK